jgi:hypothetical protein
MSVATRTWARSVNVRETWYKRLRLSLDHDNVAWNPEQRCRLRCSPITPRAESNYVLVRSFVRHANP